MVFRCGGNGGLGAHRMVLPVRMRIHWGMGLFCFCFLARCILILNVLWEGCDQWHHQMHPREKWLRRGKVANIKQYIQLRKRN